jgi:hypothetical protein
MFDSIFDIMIVLIPLSIFIGRVIVQARNKHKPRPTVKQPPIPVHFEDYEDDEDGVTFAPSAVSKPVIKSKDSLSAYTPLSSMESALKPPPATRAKAASAGSAQGARSTQGVLNLSHLSPIKQAVVMAEVLGPPKGMI